MSNKEVNVNEVREQIAEYLTRAERGEETIIKRYSKKIAKIVPYQETPRKKLPDLSDFRQSLGVSSEQPAGEILREMRDNDR
ncbi:type II toxin-antitoxin system Phd/YefM family antitoxin [Rhodohalobacter sp. 8-1]|uniref:type II toxin-antitoxin system Phd/YefM family antitoxin n=1 Tax=Rhodohalobacter sp. 8-1 TaxID=3131972 RepID=UPI0030ED850C